MLNAVEKLPKEFKPVEVSLWHNLLFFIAGPSKRKMIVPNSFTFIPMHPQVKSYVCGQELIIPLASTDEMEDNDDDGYTTEVVWRILAAKDQGLVSDKAYHELRIALPEVIRCRISPLSAILKERKRQNMSINILPMPQVKTAYSMFFVNANLTHLIWRVFFLRVFFQERKCSEILSAFT